MIHPRTDDPPMSPARLHCPRVEDDDDGSTAGGIRPVLLGVIVVLLTLVYHSHHALGQVIEGSTGDGHVVVAWEYDLDEDTGELLIQNIDVPAGDAGPPLYLAGLIPPIAANISYSPDVISLDPPCENAQVPPLTVFANLPPGNEAIITFDFAEHPQSEAVPGQVDYGQVYLMSAVACFRVPSGLLNDFVTVSPIEVTCDEPDRDGDGDVDLRDFAGFQSGFADPKQLLCYRKMLDELTGPQ